LPGRTSSAISRRPPARCCSVPPSSRREIRRLASRP
jgi:hypothetical protein